MIPSRFINETLEIHEVIPFNRNVSVPEFTKALTFVIESVLDKKLDEKLDPVYEKIEVLQERINQLSTSEELEELKKEMREIGKGLDKEALREIFQKKSFWDNIFKHK